MEDDMMAETVSGDASELNIARRTRSHLRIDDFVPNDNLDFPDVDMNLYQNPDSEGDPEYKKFLNQCYSEEIGNDANTDDNDPEYVYNDDIFSHGWRFDLNEVTELHQDDIENQNSSNDNNDEATPGSSQIDQVRLLEIPPSISMPESSDFKSPSKFRRKIDMFSEPEFARILNQQLRQHIQLLTQTYLLTKNTTNMRNEAEEAKGHLNSYMKIFKNKSKPSNLLPALDLVNNLATPKDIKSSIRLSWRPLPIPESVKTTMSDNPHVFIYPSLLPQVAFSFLPERLVPKKPKINFTINEDNLLAYALHEFKGESSQYAFIASLLMTAKTKTQISNHIKNIKRSPGNENNPIKLYYANGQLPEIDLDSDSHLDNLSNKNLVRHDSPSMSEAESPQVVSNFSEDPQAQEVDKCEVKTEIVEPEVGHTLAEQNLGICHDNDDMMNMDLDDLMAASTTISKQSLANVNSNNSESAKNVKILKLKKSMLNLMSHNFLLQPNMSDLLIQDFLKTAQLLLSERNNLHLLQLLTDLMRREAKKEDDRVVVSIYKEISKFLDKISSPPELKQKAVLFLDLIQANECGCAPEYLHWMRFFEFMQHVEMYHEGDEALEKKMVRLIDALQKDDPHKVKLAIAGLVNKHPLLKREFESLDLSEKPHPSLFMSPEDFDDITEPISLADNVDNISDIQKFEHFNSKVSAHELSYASQSCPCQCHSETIVDGQPSQHCGKCNLKFMKGRMYLVNKIKPILAEWVYTGRTETTPQKSTNGSVTTDQPQPNSSGWTFEEDREILEFCRFKAEQNDETVSFDTSTFEELVASRQRRQQGDSNGTHCKKTAREIAERFNQLMEMYKDENSNAVQ